MFSVVDTIMQGIVSLKLCTFRFGNSSTHNLPLVVFFIIHKLYQLAYNPMFSFLLTSMGILICMQVAAKVIGEAQALIIFPIIPYTILAIFYMIWFSAAFHLFSSGQVVQNNCNLNCCAYDLASKQVNCDRCCGYSIRYTPHIGVAIFFHLFGCYWVTQFFIASSKTVIAGSVASYYWTRGETSVSS